jgi:hypothetical protein
MARSLRRNADRRSGPRRAGSLKRRGSPAFAVCPALNERELEQIPISGALSRADGRRLASRAHLGLVSAAGMANFSVSDTTQGSSLTAPTQDKEGREFLAVILKYSFFVDALGHATLLDEEQRADIDLVDTYNGEDPAKASIRRPSQLFESKPGTDVVLLGHAHAPRGNEATYVDVSLRIGSVQKTVRAHGFRVWQRGTLGGLAAGPARPIREPVPLIYELAWGGQDFSDPEKPVGEPRNYAGRGVAREPAALVGLAAAQLEYPASKAGNGAVPAGFGPIHRHWQPRVSFAGTYDSIWQETRMPLLPGDFDTRFHVCVPEDQWCPVPLRGDEPVEVLGATPEGAWRFRLPRLAPGFSSVTLGQRAEHRTHLDTVLIDADTRRVELTWRAAVPLPRKWEMLERVLVFEKELV